MAEQVTDGDDSDHHRQLAIVDDVNYDSKWNSRRFSLPEDWVVEKRPRKSGSTIDTYYHDPETGRKFRSLKDVERYLTEGISPTRSNAKRLTHHEQHLQKRSNQKRIVSSAKMLDFEENEDNPYPLINVTTPASFLSASTFNLPDGWVVEEVPRKTGNRSDRYFYEPVTGHKFRSLPSVKKHLAEIEEKENSPLSAVLEELRENNLPLSKAFKLAPPIKNYGSWKKNISKKEQNSSFINAPPNKINWVISSTAEETWNAFVGDEPVPDFVRKKWGKRFMLAINDTKIMNRNEPEASFVFSGC
ncbi:hypothetical protein QVD17_17590 [Tagetes erecta]|uniref:MBD domain-containing protein n=1 Tax=Tagetes erecta TaxID=13708 RepID=A0AAD8KSH8_TARER|nr:hypothetical protein QVD17_17590 [Tagetes erecta]